MSETRYVLVKRGLYWRPGSWGYTDSILEAGTYSDEESARYVEKGSFNRPGELVTRVEVSEALKAELARASPEMRDILTALLTVGP